MSTIKKIGLTTAVTLAQLVLIIPFALAQDAAEEAANTPEVMTWKAIAASFAIAIAALGGSLAQGRAAAAALEGIARNPGAQSKVFVPMLLGLALIESLVIYALIIAFRLAP